MTHDDDVLPEKNKGSLYVIAVDNNQSSTKVREHVCRVTENNAPFSPSWHRVCKQFSFAKMQKKQK